MNTKLKILVHLAIALFFAALSFYWYLAIGIGSGRELRAFAQLFCLINWIALGIYALLALVRQAYAKYMLFICCLLQLIFIAVAVYH